MSRLFRKAGLRAWPAGMTLLLAALCVLPTGCLRRRLTIRSNPPGALAFVDDQEIGVTPVSTGFTYYGTRKIELFKDGFEPITAKHRFVVPWYEIPPLDFLSENIWPCKVRDERVVDFDLIPQQIVPNEKLVERAEGLRQSSRQGHATPLWAPDPAAYPAPPPPPQRQVLPPPAGPAGNTVQPLPPLGQR